MRGEEKKQKQMAINKRAKALFSEGLLSHMTTTLSLATIIYPVLLYPEIQLCLSDPGINTQEKEISLTSFFSVI